MTFVLAVLKKFLNESFKDISLFSYQCSLFCCCSATFISYHRLKCLSTTFLFFFFATVQQLLYLTRNKVLCQQLFKIVFCCPLSNISVSRVSLTILSCQPIIVNSFFQFIIYFRHALPIHFRTYIEMLLKNSFCLSFKSIYHRLLTVIKTASAYWLFLLGLM